MRALELWLRRLLVGAYLALMAGVAMAAPTGGAITESEAARFLTQATFGPTPAEVQHLQAIGYEAWLDEQFAMPLPALSHQAYWDWRSQVLSSGKDLASTDEVSASFWRLAITGSDQLRQRVAFALSEIFVVSLADNCGDIQGARGVASYLDMLDQMAFKRYRDLLEKVARHPTMGCYLSHLHNQKEDLQSGRTPDENFAREVMQLFSIGLYQLNLDGSVQFDSTQRPIETYQARDVSELAKVFTGFSWDCPMPRNAGCFLNGVNSGTGRSYPDRLVMPMVGYPQYHSTSGKRFLGVTIEPQSRADPDASLKVALDTLARHPNVAPFISKQLIQRLVTSNPSNHYILRVASVFKESDGNLQQTIKAILLDPEARDSKAAYANPGFGKIREPILRLTALIRAFDGRSLTGSYLMRPTDDPGFGLAQSPMRSQTVFNFFRPGYVAAGSRMASAGSVSPEMQIVNDVSAAGYVNYMRGFIEVGAGWNGYDRKSGAVDVQLDFNLNPNNPILDLTDQPDQLVDLVNRRLLYGQMPATLKRLIVDAVASIDFHPSNDTERLEMRRHRARTALLLTVSSPEFQVQK